MAKNDNLKDFLKDIADAIRYVQGISSPINPQDFAGIIRGFSSGSSGLVFPVRLYTEDMGGDFRRRESDATAVAVIDWYDNNRVSDGNGGHYMPSETLSGKLFVDDSEVTDLRYEPSLSRDSLVFESEEDYGMGESLKLIQYTATSSVQKGTIDIMVN